jgi:F-type H+-transporting ATPase subunit a
MEFHPQFNLIPDHAVYMVWLSAGLTFLVLFIGARLIAASTTGGGRFANFVEAMVDFVREQIVEEFLGEHAKKWFGFFAALFFFLLFSNLLGKVPWLKLESPTGIIDVTAAMAVFVFVIAQVVGIAKLGPAGYFRKKFLLPGAPWWVQPLAIIIMPIVLLAEPFSLCVRLFANMTAGHQVILTFATAELIGGLYLWHAGAWQKLVASLPFVLTVVLLAFELFVAFIQAFIFTLLSALYLSESLEEHH